MSEKATAKGVSVEKFMAGYDDSTKVKQFIRRAVSTMQKGSVYGDVELRQMVGYGIPQVWRRVASSEPEFIKHQFRTTDDKIWWTDEETVKELMHKASRVRAL